MKQKLHRRNPARLLAVSTLAAWSLLPAHAETVGLNWVGAGTAISHSGGAFGVPLANWNNFSGASGTATVSGPSGGAVTVSWGTGGGFWLSGPPFPGFSAGENQVFSGNLFALQNDPAGAGPITVTVSGLNSVAMGDYTL
jgi:hypothetical protein